MFEIRITNTPLLITIKFLNDVVMACGSPTPCRKNDRGPGFLAQFPSLKRATMVCQHLNNWRVIDKVLKAEVLADTKDVVDKISMVEDTAVAKEIESVFEEYKETFIIKIQGEIMKEPDIFTFKIFKCGVSKCREYDCHYYHNPFDRRRDYLEFKYSEKMCAHARDNAPCPRGEYCNMCHTPIERVFHPKNYKANVCLDWYDLKRCPRKGFCAKSHPMSTDSFFSEAWKDVFVAGLDQSFFFFTGAIKLLYKVPDNEGGVPIMFLTTQPEIAKLACEVAKPVARIHRLRIAIITDVFQDPGGAHILIGTPSGLASLVESKGSAPLGGLRVLILDDVSTLHNNPLHHQHLKYLMQAIFDEVADKKMLCKVALSETCHPSEIAKVEELLQTELALFNPHKVDTNLLPALVSVPVAPPPPSVSKGAKGGASPKEGKEDLSDWEGGGRVKEEEKEKESVTSSSRARGRRKRKGSSSSYSRDTSSSRSSSRSSRSSSRSRSRSRSRGRKRRRSGSSDSDRPKGEYSIFTSEMLSRMKCEENELFKEHGAAYEVYLEVPEMHPNYEDKYDRFLLSYKNKYNTTAESDHMTKMWQKYWKLCIENIKGKDWKRKKKELLEKYKLDARAAEMEREPKRSTPTQQEAPKQNPPPTMSSAAVVAAISEISRQRLDNFTVAGAIDLLEDLSGKVGGMGGSVTSLLCSVRLLGVKTKKGMDLICKEENIILLNELFEKILIVSQTLSGPEAEFYKKGIAWGLHLAKVAKEFNEEDEPGKEHKVRFDVNLFAQQTYNQDPNWIYDTLEQSLEYVYGAKPAPDMVKQMFGSISSIHMNMSSSTPYLLGGGPIASGYSTNPGIVSQVDHLRNPPMATTSFTNIPLTPLIPSSSSSSSSSFRTYTPYPQLPTPLVRSAASGLHRTRERHSFDPSIPPPPPPKPEGVPPPPPSYSSSSSHAPPPPLPSQSNPPPPPPDHPPPLPSPENHPSTPKASPYHLSYPVTSSSSGNDSAFNVVSTIMNIAKNNANN